MKGNDIRQEWGFPIKLNTRPISILLLFFIGGIVACTLDFLYCVICLCLLVVCAFILLFIGKIDKPLFVLCIVFILLSLVYPAIVGYYNKNAFCSTKNVFFSGRVVEVGSNSYRLDRLNIDGLDYKGELELICDDDLYLGYSVTCYGVIDTLKVEENDSYVMHNFSQKLYYSCEAAYVELDYIDDIPVRIRIVDAVKVSISEAVGEDVAGFAVSMLFGATEYLDYDTKLDYRTVGSSHVFAVSGLHVGVILGIIFFLFKKFRCSKLKSLPVLVVFLGFYAFLCDFSPSVIRASIMAITYMLFRVTSHCPDRLNVISLSALISLVAKPYWLFDISFLLSYFAILGIYLIYPQIRRFLSKFLKKGVDSLSMNLAVCTSLAPITIFFFDEFSLFSVLASLFVIPVASFIFVIFFITLPIVWYTPVAIFPLSLAKYILIGLNYIISVLANVNVSVGLKILPEILPIWYSGILILSDYNVADKQPKRIFGYTVLLSAFGLCFV